MVWLPLMLGCAAAASAEHVSIRAAEVPQGWKAGDRADAAHKLELTFAVKHSNTAALEAALLRVSDPDSAEYGKHLTQAQVHELVAPAAAHLSAVESFIRAHGAEPKRVTPTGTFVTAEVSVAQAERMLSTQYLKFTHSSGRTVHRSPTGYSLPAAVAAAVDIVGPTTHLPGVRRVRTQKVGSGFGDDNTPKNLRELYSVGNVTGKASSNRQAVTAFLGQYYSKSDLESYWKEYCDGIACGMGAPKLVGDATTGSAGVESMLDIESITGVAGNVESEFWGYSGHSEYDSENEPFLKWLAAVDKTPDATLPKIFSTSYGEDESTWPLEGFTRLNQEYQKGGARGVTFLYASGDYGANCQDNKFTPTAPASSPYVTAVGGTGPTTGFPKPGSEEAIGLSTGGFSNYWTMPSWQTDAVAGYLAKSGLPGKKYGYNTSNRAYPDIAAQATNFCVVPFGCGVAGTSCASPTAAGIFSLVNDMRLQNGKSSLGFLNPFLYKNAAAFNDITTGSSEGCSEGGWPAKEGWDAVTGLGTPNYAKLAKAAMALP